MSLYVLDERQIYIKNLECSQINDNFFAINWLLRLRKLEILSTSLKIKLHEWVINKLIILKALKIKILNHEFPSKD